MKLVRQLAIIFIVWLIATLLINHFRVGFDDSDDYVNGERSGMAVRTDHLTGCQYLGSIWGSATPRLNRHGEQICRTP